MKKIISIILVFVMLLSVCVLSATAATAPAGYIGDANFDRQTDINDATFIRFVLAEIEEADVEQTALGDVDMDGRLSIIDATIIQMHLADMEVDSFIGLWYNYDSIENDFYSDYESGVAMAGVPVTFTVNACMGSPVLSYELYVDGVSVASSDSNSVTYTFAEAGEYDIEMRINAVFSTGSVEEKRFKVVEPFESETPMFKTLYTTGKIQWGTITYDMNNIAVHADAIGGKAPYQYRFEFERPYNAWEPNNTFLYYQDYSEDNVFELEPIEYPGFGLSYDMECNLTVYIKDANGSVVSREMPIIYSADIPVG